MLAMIELLSARAFVAIEGIRDREEGQTIVEYVLILALFSVVAAAAFSGLASAVTAKISTIVSQI